MQLGVLKSGVSPLVPLVPSLMPKYQKDGFDFLVEAGAGRASFYADDLYLDAGARLGERSAILRESDIVMVDSYLAPEELNAMKSGALLIGRFNVLNDPSYAQQLHDTDLLVFSLDLVPRSSIAQSMDVLSSLASLSGYKAVLAAANRFSGYFPMMTTAAGTVPPAKVLVLGAGVAGLQAIATARRLGAVVEAFDVRSAVKEEVESLGARFIEVPGGREDENSGGYAVMQSEEYIQKQKELIHDRAGKSDVVIATASIPGRKAPLLVEKRTVEQMKPGSIIVDLASATGGNCELTQDNKEILVSDVTIIGDSRLFYQLPKEASRLYSTNLYHFIRFILKDGIENIPYDHEIVQKTLITERRMAEIAI